MRENVTVIFKSFERQKMAKRLYENLQKYYPGVRVVIADDSRKPLDLQGDSLTIIQLPFNSGLSYGLNQALERVDTPYVMRMDDDELLTVRTRLGKQVEFGMWSLRKRGSLQKKKQRVLEFRPDVVVVSLERYVTLVWQRQLRRPERQTAYRNICADTQKQRSDI